MRDFCKKVIGFFYHAATGPARVRWLLTPLAAAFFVGLILLTIAASLLADGFFGFARFISLFHGAALAVPILIGGGLLWLWSVWRFLKTKGTPVPVNPPQVLVTDGPYAYSRNPMLTAVFLMLAGLGILFGSVTLTFIATPVFVFVSVLEFRYIEEPELERRFGAAYKKYREKTPMFFPRLIRK